MSIPAVDHPVFHCAIRREVLPSLPMESDLRLTLLSAQDDPYYLDLPHQQELRSFALALYNEGLLVATIPPAPPKAGDPFLSVEFVLRLTEKIGPPLLVGISKWLEGRSGRKVRLKLGDIEEETSTIEEAEKLVVLVLEFQQHGRV